MTILANGEHLPLKYSLKDVKVFKGNYPKLMIRYVRVKV